MPTRLRRLSWTAALVAALSVGSLAAPLRAEAQPAADMGQSIDATPKGTIGLGIIGAEIGFAVPALAGIDGAWAYVVFPVIGAAGGAIGGFYAIDNNDNERAAVAMLTVGMALMVPTLVLTLAMTAYDPDDDVEDSGDSGGDDLEEGADADEAGDEAAEPEPSARQETLRRRARAARAGAGLLRFDGRSLQLGVPGFGLRAAYSRDEQWRYGGTNRTGVEIALVSGAF